MAAPPLGVISALENQCKVKKDASACKWVVDLDKHYEKLEVK